MLTRKNGSFWRQAQRIFSLKDLIYPPSQPTASTKVEQVLQALQAGSASGGQ